MAISLAEVRQLSVGALRVRFTSIPFASDEDVLNDALNPDNYSLSGPNDNYAIGVVPVDGDPYSFDVNLAAALQLGTWTVAVANIEESATDDPLTAPTSLGLFVSRTYRADALGHGAANDETENVIRRFLNPALKGSGWESMISALAAGDQRNWDNARLAFNQLFLSSAEGLYLDRRGSDVGVERPRGVNMSDDLFRQLAIVQKTGKLTQQSILEVLEVFYGRDATRAYSDSAAETFALEDEDELAILFDERQTVTVLFQREHFARINQATSLEVAAAITRACKYSGSGGYAVSFVDPITNENKVRIYSGSLGLTSSVRIVGGKANTRLLFATPLFEQTGSTPFATWNVSLSPDTQGNLRFTMTAGTEFDLFLVHEGDLAYVYGEEFLVTDTQGTFEIQRVSVTYSGVTKIQWFEIENPLGTAAAGIVQTGFEDLMFFRPKRRTIYDNPRHVIVCENDDHLDVIIPATTEVVGRGPGLAAYLRENDTFDILSLVRAPDGLVTVETDGSHGLVAGDQFIVDGVLPSGEAPPSDAATPSEDFVDDEALGQTGASYRSTFSEAGTFAAVYSKTVRLPSGQLFLVGGQLQDEDAVTITPSADLVIFDKTADNVGPSGGAQQDYRWRRFSRSGPPGQGPILWLMGNADFTQSAGLVDSWQDQSGYDQHMDTFTNAGAYDGTGIDGVPGVSSTTTNKYIERNTTLLDRNGNPVSGSTTRTVFVVCQPGSNGTRTGGVMVAFKHSSGSGSYAMYHLGLATFGPHTPALVVHDWWPEWSTPLESVAAVDYVNTPILVTDHYDSVFGTMERHYNNVNDPLYSATIGVGDNGGSGAGIPFTVGNVGGFGGYVSYGFIGLITEVIVFDYDLRTDADAHDWWINYLADKYPSLGL